MSADARTMSTKKQRSLSILQMPLKQNKAPARLTTQSRFCNLSGLHLKAFTLIELLVVIAIIALLMGILMPALARAKKQARAAACQMNLHQWSTIWAMYCQDNNGRFCMEADNVGWPRGNWIVVLRPYYQTRSGILTCPMATKPHPAGGSWGGPFNTYVMGTGGIYDWQEEGSYGANCWLYSRRPGQDKIQNRPVKWNWQTVDVKGANKIPVFADTMWRGGGPFYMDGNPQSNRIVPPEYHGQWRGAGYEMSHFCIDRHGGGTVNSLFLDWSIRKVGLKGWLYTERLARMDEEL